MVVLSFEVASGDFVVKDDDCNECENTGGEEWNSNGSSSLMTSKISRSTMGSRHVKHLGTLCRFFWCCSACQYITFSPE